jgi:hypothetical protein
MTWVLDHTERITIALNIMVYALLAGSFWLWATIYAIPKVVAIAIGIVVLIGVCLSFGDEPVYIEFNWHYDTDNDWQTIYDRNTDKTYVSLMFSRFLMGDVATTMLNSHITSNADGLNQFLQGDEDLTVKFAIHQTPNIPTPEPTTWQLAILNTKNVVTEDGSTYFGDADHWVITKVEKATIKGRYKQVDCWRGSMQPTDMDTDLRVTLAPVNVKEVDA